MADLITEIQNVRKNMIDRPAGAMKAITDAITPVTDALGLTTPSQLPGRRPIDEIPVVQVSPDVETIRPPGAKY